MNKSYLTIALAGNPNSGKTTIFNSITGSRQHVGNYPGVTIEKKEGYTTFDDVELRIVDLPGTYSLTAYSVEEIVTQNYILDSALDVVIDIIDSSNLERNLYLATQLIESGVPLVLAFNKSDLAENRGYHIDNQKLSDLFGVPIISTVGLKGKGIQKLLAAAVTTAQNKTSAIEKQRQVDYGHEIEPHIQELTNMLPDACCSRQLKRWYAIKLLENDQQAIKRLKNLVSENPDSIFMKAEKLRHHLESVCGDTPEIVMADRRYGFISGACTEAVTQSVETRHVLSDQIDTIFTNHVIGLPIFALLMYLVFHLTFTLAESPMNWIEQGFDWLGGFIKSFWPKGSASPLLSLLVDGIIGGVGGVIVFLPNILLLFLSIALLEDTGYMARAAFIVDRLMHKIGLHGKSFIPMLIGFGCSVPGILATRTLETRRDRLTTMLVLPLMSCGARLPIYSLIIPAFFPSQWRAPILWLIYLIGIVLAIICAKLLRLTLFKGESTPFVMELPPYRLPTIKGLLIHMWDRSWLYLKKAGTIILGLSIVLWALTTFPRKTQFDQDYNKQLSQARSEYLAGISSLNTALGLENDSNVITKALSAEMHLQDAQEQFHHHEKGFVNAQEQYNASIEVLKSSPEGEILTEFLQIRNMVDNARISFESAANENGIDDHSPKYADLVTKRDLRLAEAQKINPQIYTAVIQYLDDIKKPMEEKISDINNSKQAEMLTYAITGRIGRGIEPLLRPMGFDWRIGTALIGAMAAKEVFVAQMGIVFSAGQANENSETLRSRLREHYSPLTGLCIMLFCLISSPCVATIAVTKQESNSWKWAIFQFCSLTAIAFILTTMVYQVGRLFM